MNDRQLGAIAILSAAAVWSTAGLFMGLLSQLDAWTILLWRSVFGALIVIVVAFVSQEDWRRSPMSWGTWFLAMSSSALGMIAFIPALRMTSVANVAMIHASLPILSAIAGMVLLREKPSQAILLFSVLAFLGATVIFIGSAGRGANQLGNCLALLMTASIAVMTAALRAHSGSVLPIIAASNMVAAGVAFGFSPGRHIDLGQAFLLAGFAAIQMGLGLALYSMGAKLLPSGEAGLLSLVEVPLSPLWVWLAFNQRPSFASCLGGLIILVAAGGYIVRLRRREPIFSARRKSKPDDLI